MTPRFGRVFRLARICACRREQVTGAGDWTGDLGRTDATPRAEGGREAALKASRKPRNLRGLARVGEGWYEFPARPTRPLLDSWYRPLACDLNPIRICH